MTTERPQQSSPSEIEHDDERQAVDGLNAIERALVERLAPIEWLLTPDQIVFMRRELARATGDALELFIKLGQTE